MKKDSIPRWINTILVSLLLAVMSVSMGRQKELNDNTELLQIELAIVATKFEQHLKFSDEGMAVVNHNREDIHLLKETYVTRAEIRQMLDEIKQYIRENS